MKIQNCQVNLTGLLISKKKQLHIKGLLQELVRNSPSDSALTLCLDNGEYGANGQLNMVSGKLNFECSHHGDTPSAVVESLSRALQERLDLWIFNRKFL